MEIDKKDLTAPLHSQAFPHDFERLSCISKFTFWWVWPFLKASRKAQMTQEDLMNLPKEFLQSPVNFRYFGSLRQSLKSAYLSTVLWLGFQGAVLSAFDFVLPLYIVYMEDYIEENRALSEGVFSLLLVALSMLIKALIQSRQSLALMRLRISMKKTVLELIYNTSLTLKEGISIGQAVNVMQVDAAKVYESAQWAVYVLYYPLHFLAAVLLLCQLLGLAGVVGIVAFCGIFMFNFFVERTIHKLNLKIMTLKDDRMKCTTELLTNIRPLKISNWEDALAARVVRSRAIESLWTKYYMKLRAVSICSLWSAPVIVSIIMFLFYVYVFGHQLSVTVAFGTVSTLFILQIPLRELPSSISNLSLAYSSSIRIDAFLQKEPVETRISGNSQTPRISLESASFSYTKTAPVVLQDLSFTCESGDFIAVIGSVGAGKTSFLKAVLGEMHLVSGLAEVTGSVAFCGSIDSWILNASIRENITIGRDFNELRYREVLEACALEQDLAALPDGDLTEIGERGINLSGGQKARVSLARGVYTDSDIYLLDDPLGAVDAHVRKHIFYHCFLGLLRGKTRVLITHSLEYLKSVDRVLTMKEGRITNIGQPSDADIQSDGVQERPVLDENQISVSTAGRLIKDEERAHGSVSWAIHRAYIDLAGGLFAAFLLILIIAGWILSRVSADISLQHWGEGEHSYMIGFIILSLISAVCIFFRVYVLAVSGVNAAIKIHNLALEAVIRAPINLYFDVTPMGRLLNRFSKDLHDMDVQLPFSFGSVLTSYATLIGTVLVSAIYVPAILLIVPVLYWAADRCQTYYLAGSNNTNRMLRNANSPIVQHFTESLSGLKIIRSQGLTSLSIKTNSDYVVLSNQIMFNEFCSNIWLNLMLNCISIVYFILITGFLVLEHENLSPGVIGLVITYMLPLPRAINNNTLFISLLKTNMISMERIHQLTK